MIRLACLNDYEQIQEIFWKTSSKTQFDSDKLKKEFEYKYLEYYFKNERAFFFVYISEEKVIGYICALLNILKHPNLFELLPYHSGFKEEFVNYPCECHINLAPHSQGKGIGSSLLKKMKNELKLAGSKGYFIFTALEADNITFYRKNGLCDIMCQGSILMMGQKLK